MDPISFSIELELGNVLLAAVAAIASYYHSRHQKQARMQHERHFQQRRAQAERHHRDHMAAASKVGPLEGQPAGRLGQTR